MAETELSPVVGFSKLWENDSCRGGPRGSRRGRGRRRSRRLIWTNVEGPNGSYDESLRKPAEQRCGGLVEHPLWSALGLDEAGRVLARVRVAFEDLPSASALSFACDEKDDGPRGVYDGDG